jgi:ketosteroid isomerase-like protein
VFDEIIAAYDAAWNEADAAARVRQLERSLSEDAELVDPTGHYRGRAAVADRIEGFSDRFPGARVTITSGVDAHHGFARYSWHITGSDGTTLLEGIDVVEQSSQHDRLQRVIMFFGALPPAQD